MVPYVNLTIIIQKQRVILSISQKEHNSFARMRQEVTRSLYILVRDSEWCHLQFFAQEEEVQRKFVQILFFFFSLWLLVPVEQMAEQSRGARRAQYNNSESEPMGSVHQNGLWRDAHESKKRGIHGIARTGQSQTGAKNQTKQTASETTRNPEQRESRHEQTAHKPGSCEQAITNNSKSKNRPKNPLNKRTSHLGSKHQRSRTTFEQARPQFSYVGCKPIFAPLAH